MNFKKWARHRGDGSPLCISVANLPSGFFQSPYLIGFGLACPQRRCMLLIAKWTFGLGPFADLRRSRGILVFDGRAIAADRGFCLLLGSPLARFAPQNKLTGARSCEFGRASASIAPHIVHTMRRTGFNRRNTASATAR
jgi:hypothetical protein